jgi:adenylate cyclase
MSQAIARHHGTVDKFLGDSIMAFWGAPAELPGHALAACQGALEMRRTLASLQARWRARGRPILAAKIGINTGNAVVGNIGAPDRLNYTVIGDSVNLASRLEGLNRLYGTELLIGERTAALVGEALVLRPLDWVAVKGKTQPVLVHELVGAPGEVSREILGGLARYREGLLAYRERRFEEARAAFSEAAKLLGPAEIAAPLLAERCRRFLSEPPPADWSGVSTMTFK